jgi:hypothetical protein
MFWCSSYKLTEYTTILIIKGKISFAGDREFNHTLPPWHNKLPNYSNFSLQPSLGQSLVNYSCARIYLQVAYGLHQHTARSYNLGCKIDTSAVLCELWCSLDGAAPVALARTTPSENYLIWCRTIGGIVAERLI